MPNAEKTDKGREDITTTYFLQTFFLCMAPSVVSLIQLLKVNRAERPKRLCLQQVGRDEEPCVVCDG